MSALALSLCALLLSAPPPPSAPRSATVQPGESLAQLAKRTVGDEGAASEIKALNRLGDGPLQPGTELKLPGADRAQALRALATVRRALAQTDPGTAGRAEALKRLGEADAHFREARYAEAQGAADAAWALAGRPPLSSKFTVEVNPQGATQVTARTGQPVLVEAEGVTRVVSAGQKSVVEKGQAPTQPADALAPPVLEAPADRLPLKFKPTSQGLGPVLLSWTPVPGATGYEVEVTVADGRAPLVVKVTGPEAKLAPLPPGRYFWAVRSVAEEVRSELSARRSFELQAEQIRLEVRGAGWK